MLHVALAALAAGPPSTATASTVLALTQPRTTWSPSGSGWSTTQTSSQVRTCTALNDASSSQSSSRYQTAVRQQCAMQQLLSRVVEEPRRPHIKVAWLLADCVAGFHQEAA
jgi:hypothetical protein